MESLKLYPLIINPSRMKVGIMKASVAVLIILGLVAVFLLAADGIESEGLTITGSARPISSQPSADPQSTEDGIAKLHPGPLSNGVQDNGIHSTFFAIDIDPAQSNRTVHDLSKLFNLSIHNSTNSIAKNASIVNTRTLNWTATGTTALNATASNKTIVNATAINVSNPGGTGKNLITSYMTGTGSISGSTEAGPEGMSTNSQSKAVGSYNYSSSQCGLGRSRIKSSMALEGDFEVQRSSSY